MHPGRIQKMPNGQSLREIAVRTETPIVGSPITYRVTSCQNDPNIDGEWYTIDVTVTYKSGNSQTYDFHEGFNASNGLTLPLEVQLLEGLALQAVAQVSFSSLPQIDLTATKIKLNRGPKGEHSVFLRVRDTPLRSGFVVVELKETEEDFFATQVHIEVGDSGYPVFTRELEGWKKRND